MNNSELIARLRNTPNWQRESYGDWKNGTLFYDRAPFEAADALEAIAALQSLERVPMTDDEIAGVFVGLQMNTPSNGIHEEDGLFWHRFARALEAHHNITPPESKG